MNVTSARRPVAPRPRSASPLKSAPAQPARQSPLTDRPRAPLAPLSGPKPGPLATVLMAGGAIGGLAALLAYITGGGAGALLTAGLSLGTALVAGLWDEKRPSR